MTMTKPEDIYILAQCPLRHEHCIGMKRRFVGWLEKHRHEEMSFELSRCPWGVELEASSSDNCPNCGQQLRNGRFCCAFPLDEDAPD